MSVLQLDDLEYLLEKYFDDFKNIDVSFEAEEKIYSEKKEVANKISGIELMINEFSLRKHNVQNTISDFQPVFKKFVEKKDEIKISWKEFINQVNSDLEDISSFNETCLNHEDNVSMDINSENFEYRIKPSNQKKVVMCSGCENIINDAKFLSLQNEKEISFHIEKFCLVNQNLINAKCFVYKLLNDNSDLKDLEKCGFTFENIIGFKPSKIPEENINFYYKQKSPLEPLLKCTTCNDLITESAFISSTDSPLTPFHLKENCIIRSKIAENIHFSKIRCITNDLLTTHQQLKDIIACGFYTRNILGYRPQNPLYLKNLRNRKLKSKFGTDSNSCSTKSTNSSNKIEESPSQSLCSHSVNNSDNINLAFSPPPQTGIKNNSTHFPHDDVVRSSSNENILGYRPQDPDYLNYLRNRKLKSKFDTDSKSCSTKSTNSSNKIKESPSQSLCSDSVTNSDNTNLAFSPPPQTGIKNISTPFPHDGVVRSSSNEVCQLLQNEGHTRFLSPKNDTNQQCDGNIQCGLSQINRRNSSNAMIVPPVLPSQVSNVSLPGSSHTFVNNQCNVTSLNYDSNERAGNNKYGNNKFKCLRVLILLELLVLLLLIMKLIFTDDL